MRLSLRARIVFYLVAIHLLFAGVAALVLLKEPLVLFAVEAVFALSIWIGYRLVRSFFLPLDLIRTGAVLIGERDFTSSFREVGSPEMDALIGVYNRMIARLREERLKLTEQHYFLDLVLSASPAGILTLDFDGRVSRANPSAAALLGLPGEALVGRPIFELPTPLAAALAALPVGRSQILPATSGRRLRASRAELFDRGFPRSFFVLEELTDELRASEKAAYGKLIRMMSHEINNSVAAVGSLLDSFRGYSDQLRPDDRGDFDGALAVAITRLENLRAFMNGFAEVVRLPAPERRPEELPRLLDELHLLLRPELERRRIRWQWNAKPAAPLPPILLDRNQMEQVLLNALRNAMESIGEDGTIALSLSTATGRPVLKIADSGEGIAEEVRALLFTPFFSTKKNGRGLGLTLVQEILTAHGFDFSLGPGEGGRGAELWIAF
jgi:two-component system, NtrC family, nitrogen regulation sensor histidine kinase NtrY